MLRAKSFGLGMSGAEQKHRKNYLLSREFLRQPVFKVIHNGKLFLGKSQKVGLVANLQFGS